MQNERFTAEQSVGILNEAGATGSAHEVYRRRASRRRGSTAGAGGSAACNRTRPSGSRVSRTRTDG
jgi:hypothetical protein